MKKGLCVYPGSFDPVTIGHLDLIERGADIFPEVVVAVLHNPAKEGCFPIAQRLELLSRACAHLPNVRFDQFDGLLVEFVKKNNAAAIVKGLRAVSDYEYELQMAMLNKHIDHDIETIFLMADIQNSFLSSSIVKDLAKHGGDITGLVPDEIKGDITSKLRA